MKTENQLNTDILKMTLTIRDNFPELSKYLSEMTITIPDEKKPEINLKTLQDYYNSLEVLLEDYKLNHHN